MIGINDPAVQRLQYFLSESVCNLEAVNDRRVALLRADPATAPHRGGVLVIDDSGDRKDGHATDHVFRQLLGWLGKTDNGIVTTLWADERLYVPLHAQPYTAACRLPRGTNDPAFATKPRIAAALAGGGPPGDSANPGGEPSPPPGEGRRLGGQSTRGGGKISSHHERTSFLAAGAAPRPRLAHPLDTAPALLARLVQRALAS